MLLLVRSGGAAALPEWQEAFRACAPELEVRGWDDPSVDPASVTHALVWEPEPGRLARFPNLRLILSTAAGVDHITRDPAWPRHVPILRMAAPETAQTVGEYVCLAALMLLRDFRRLEAARAARRWDWFEAPRPAGEVRVGIMGMGNIGQVTARMLRGLGFGVHGWARTPKAPEVELFAGPAALDEFLARTDMLVGLLPDTPETRGLLDAGRLARLPRGSTLINAGRGTLVVMADLIAALDSGHLAGAVLDVFEEEPLPPNHPAWRHPAIFATSHVAGYAPRRARAQYAARAIAAHARGERLANLYDPARGY